MANKTTNIKLSTATKERLDHLQVYPKEPYDRILTRILEILNTARGNPLKARAMLIGIDRQRKMNDMEKPKKQENKNPEPKIMKEKIFDDGN